MTEKRKTTAPVSSVGADGEQPKVKKHTEIIANENKQINLQATNCPEKSGRGGGLQTVSMTELYDTVYPPRTPVVDGFLYCGTYLFVGAPKVGKSFFMGQLAYHVAMGLPLWNYPVRKGTVLYLALEDDYARLQRRLSVMFGVECADNLFFATQAKTLNEGLDGELEGFLKEHKDARLIIIDTLQKVREVGGDRYSYSSDYEIVTKLKTFSDKYGVCLLVVHHTRKLESEDSFDMISDLFAIASDVFGEDDSVCTAFGQADIILDASASIAVERYLALDVQSDARRISCFLNPQGTATIMLLESADRSARLDLLEMQYYRELLKDEKYSDHMSLPETMVYSGTCRSISSRISQDNVSLSAALCCKAIKLHAGNANGEIIIWTHATDSVEKESFMADKWITCEYDGWKVELSLSLLGEMRTDRESALPNETGGVLIGAYDIARKCVYVVYQVKAPEDSISSPTSFIRGCANLPECLKYIHETTLDNLTYIGEWHSHPSANTQRSTDDVKLHKAIINYNRENCLPGCMMILGSNNFSIFIGE